MTWANTVDLAHEINLEIISHVDAQSATNRRKRFFFFFHARKITVNHELEQFKIVEIVEASSWDSVPQRSDLWEETARVLPACH